jgi:hypothetical protein
LQGKGIDLYYAIAREGDDDQRVRGLQGKIDYRTMVLADDRRWCLPMTDDGEQLRWCLPMTDDGEQLLWTTTAICFLGLFP